MVLQRYLIYGVTGSGKTTLARRLSERTGIPWHSVDDITWMANWQEVEHGEQRRRIQAICEGDAWILDTAYGRWVDIPLARAQAIVCLDYPRWISLSRLLKRTFSRVIDRKPICNGNVETMRQVLSRQSIIVWHFRSFRRKRERANEWAKAGLPIVMLRTPKQTESWLNSVDRLET